MMLDATDLEITRREHAIEMGGATRSESAWYSWYDRAAECLNRLGWDEKFAGGPEIGKSRGLDGSEDENGYSIDGAYEAWVGGLTVAAYMGNVKVARERLGL